MTIIHDDSHERGFPVKEVWYNCETCQEKARVRREASEAKAAERAALNGSMCGCGFPRNTSITRCGCGYSNCSKTGPDGAVCDNPYHSQDL